MTIEKVKELLDKYHVKYDMAGDTIRAYCSSYGNDYNTIRITECGDVSINGRIDDIYNWLEH